MILACHEPQSETLRAHRCAPMVHGMKHFVVPVLMCLAVVATGATSTAASAATSESLLRDALAATWEATDVAFSASWTAGGRTASFGVDNRQGGDPTSWWASTDSGSPDWVASGTVAVYSLESYARDRLGYWDKRTERILRDALLAEGHDAGSAIRLAGEPGRQNIAYRTNPVLVAQEALDRGVLDTRSRSQRGLELYVVTVAQEDATFTIAVRDNFIAWVKRESPQGKSLYALKESGVDVDAPPSPDLASAVDSDVLDYAVMFLQRERRVKVEASSIVRSARYLAEAQGRTLKARHVHAVLAERGLLDQSTGEHLHAAVSRSGAVLMYGMPTGDHLYSDPCRRISVQAGGSVRIRAC